MHINSVEENTYRAVQNNFKARQDLKMASGVNRCRAG